MSFEGQLQNNPEILESRQVDKRILAQKEADLRDLFSSSASPIEVIIAEMQTEELKGVAGEDLANKTIAQLRSIIYGNEDDFVVKVMRVMMPVLEITQKGKEDAYKQEGRDMYTRADVESTISIIRESGAEKVYVIGNIGSGKTTFAREVSRELGFKNIDVDRWFQIFRQEQNREASGLVELIEYILQKEKPPFIINHADLLRQNLIYDADLIIYLNPKKGELIESRKIRNKNGAEGEWQAVNEDDYDKIEKANSTQFEAIGGTLEYNNEKSGTSIKMVNSK